MPKLPSKISVDSLGPLIDELTKDNPNPLKVKKMMEDQGLHYSDDHIQQMGLVLSMMSDLKLQGRRKKQAELADA